MSEATIRAALRLLLSRCAPGDSVSILWHAGEPLAIGLQFFENATKIIREYGLGGVRLSQIVQTNGTLITKEWCEFFIRENFLVGVSVDGPAVVHDRHRRTLGNRQTHESVMRGVNLLKQYDIPLHAVAVLTPSSLNFANEIFDFFAEVGFRSVGFNLEETEGVHRSAFGDKIEVRPFRKKYEIFMSRIFERWHAAGEKPRIREFEGMIASIGAFLKNPKYYRTADDLTPFSNIVVNRDGEISTFSPELASGIPGNPFYFSIGNVHSVQSFDELVDSQNFKKLAKEIGSGVARCQSECEYFPICGGGTASNKFYEKGTFDCTETTNCALHRKALANVVIEGLRKLSISMEAL